MKKDNRILFLSLTILIILGINVLFIFNDVLFPFTSPIYYITWALSYIFLIIRLLYIDGSYSNFEDVDVKNNKKIINAIIPTYNEDEKILLETIDSILNQNYDVDKIYVVDDGSKLPINKKEHPKVVWLHEKNSGKRHAQKLAISYMDESNIDFILTVDSDSILELNATKKMIGEFEKNDSLMGITGFVLTRNFRNNILTRMVDLNIAKSCLLSRPIRSRFGSLETTSGALSMYRKEILFNNIDDYVSSGTYSDDRQLCFYSLKRGDVIALTDLIVTSDMPSTFDKLIKQRVRWSKGSWKFFPRQMKELPWKKKIFPIISMIETLMILVFFTFIVKSIYYKDYHMIIYYFIIRYVVGFSESLLYLGNEKRMSIKEKIVTLLLITPIEILFTMFILSPIKYISLFYLKNDRWMTR